MKIICENLDLDQIHNSGQSFRWQKLPDQEKAYLIPAFGKILEISQTDKELTLSCSEEDFNLLWKDYFDLDTDYGALARSILSSGDEYLIRAYQNSKGVRILRQELWEMIVTFMISQNNNISRIRKSVELICQRAADSPSENNSSSGLAPFPSPDQVPEGFFMDKSLGLGYRDEYLEGLFAYARSNPQWLRQLSGLDYQNAYSRLLQIKGIGKKVANCICLFGLHHINAFPIDTHIKQLLSLHYPQGFDFKRYEGFAGIVQQYMFYDKINNPDAKKHVSNTART